MFSMVGSNQTRTEHQEDWTTWEYLSVGSGGNQRSTDGRAFGGMTITIVRARSRYYG